MQSIYSFRIGITCGVAMLLLFLTAACPAAAQDPSETGHDYLNRKRFPWYESESKSFRDLKRKDPGRAASLNRDEIPIHSPAGTTPGGGWNMNPGWLSLFSSTVWAVMAVVFLVIIAVLVWVFFQMENRTATSSTIDDDEVEKMQERIKQLPFQVSRSITGDFRALAWEAAQRGDYGRASMLLFSHVLILLDQKGLIDLKRGKTNRQYLRELKRHDVLTSYYQQVMVPFEDSFFGSHEIAKTVFDQCWGELDRFQDQVSEAADTAIAPT